MQSRFPKTIAQSQMRTINRSAVLEYLRLVHQASRSQIADQLNLSRPTVMRIVDELIEDGLVRTEGKVAVGKGRAHEMLALHIDGNAVLGLDVGGSHISGALVDIGGEVLFQKEVKDPWHDAEHNFEALKAFIQDLIQEAGSYPHHLLGVGLGIPGVVDGGTGKIVLAPSLDWSNFPLLERLQASFDLPFIIENDVNLAVMGEYWFGAGQDADNVVMIAIGTGIGMGIILNGELYRGANFASGEVGYMLPGIEHLNYQYPGFGALEGLSSGKGIADRAKIVLADSLPADELATVNGKYVFEAARNGEVWAQSILVETVDLYSLMIANVDVCFDPGVIILGGSVSKSHDLLIEPIQTLLEGVVPQIAPIRPSQLFDDATIMGAVVQVFRQVTGYTTVNFA